MMHLAERSRQFVEEYFELAEKGLWFSYTHLVCRTAEPGECTCERFVVLLCASSVQDG